MPTPDTVSVSDLEALMLESEADIRAADRDLREIAELESRGVLDAGKLPSVYLIDAVATFLIRWYQSDHEPLQPRVDALIKAHLEDLALFDSLEDRISKLIANYSSHVSIGGVDFSPKLTWSPPGQWTIRVVCCVGWRTE